MIRLSPALCATLLAVTVSRAAHAETTSGTETPVVEPGPADELQGSIKLTVSDRDPGKPWILRIENLGEKELALVGDARLLWFEAKVPGKKTSVECRLPKAMIPPTTKAQKSAELRLKSGEAFIRHFDPRFYCFAEGDQRVLVPGTILTPHFGWDDDTKVTWARGKRVVTVLPATPPLVLSTVVETSTDDDGVKSNDETPSDSAPGDESPAREPAPPAPPVGLRHLDGEPFALGSSYAIWSATRLPEDKTSTEDLRLRVVKGSDAETERNVSLTIGMTNQTTKPLRLFFRRELLSFDIVGPDGNKSCARDDIPREPERQAFLSLAPGREMLITSRLIELCPRGSFKEPGFYLVNASLNASYGGEAYGFDAYVGEVAATTPRPIRVRKSEEPYLVTSPLPVGPGVPAAVAPQGVAVPVPPPPPQPAPVQVVPTPQPNPD